MTIQCRLCKKPVEVPATKEQIQRWRNGELIQRATPNLTPDQREMLITRYCDECFNRITKEPEEDEEATIQ